MFLKRIEIEGFKSFANKTIITFPINGLVGFVGPNGVGKSNINDAIKWVLGEQSVKSLRGGSMADIIFSGSENQKESDVCKVTLIFNNSKKILNSNYAEVEVTRKLIRNQQNNEYYINKTKCRLKDIRYLMMNTGLGKNSFSIVSQGTISQLADSKPFERRTIFEEAAGVSVYKEQKLESLRKLDRATQNLEIIEVSVSELKRQIIPLKKQSEKVIIYNKKKKILEKYEISLISEELKYDLEDIEKVNLKIKKLTIENNLKTNLIDVNQKKTNQLNEKIISFEGKIHNLQIQQRNYQNKLSSLSIISIETDQSINNENITKLLTNLVNDNKKLKDQIKSEIENIQKLNSNSNELIENLEKEEILLEDTKLKISKASFEKDILETNLKNKNHLFSGPETILKNKAMFLDVVDVISNLFTVDKKYEVAIQTILGISGIQNIVIKNNNSVKKAVDYLKVNKIGRATFLPLNIITEKSVDIKTKIILENHKGFEGISSELVKSKDSVQPAIKFLLGNTIIFDNFENALSVSKLINSKYKIVTLDGEIIDAGFSITGGIKSSSTESLNLESKLKDINTKLSDLNNSKNLHDEKIDSFENKIFEINESTKSKSNNIARLEEKDIYSAKRIDSLKSQYKSILGKEFISKEKSISKNPDNISNILSQINTEIESNSNIKIKYLKEYQAITLQVNNWNNELLDDVNKLSELKIHQNKLETKIGQNVIILNDDYSLTIDSIKSHKWNLKESKDKIREIVKRTKIEIKELGYVNIDSLEQYNEIKIKYDDLDNNYQELIKARNDVINTIKILDSKMEKNLKTIVERVKKEFVKISKNLFRGGDVNLRWEDEDDVLNSGVEVIARPPGKEILPISLLSGGEKSMLAIALIFAILKVSNMPLLILDEAEAALDEANVERYSKYCLELNKITQVLLVTHRPGTMENCDLLYGITMEKKGITKIVSVKLEQAKELVD